MSVLQKPTEEQVFLRKLKSIGITSFFNKNNWEQKDGKFIYEFNEYAISMPISFDDYSKRTFLNLLDYESNFRFGRNEMVEVTSENHFKNIVAFSTITIGIKNMKNNRELRIRILDSYIIEGKKLFDVRLNKNFVRTFFSDYN